MELCLASKSDEWPSQFLSEGPAEGGGDDRGGAPSGGCWGDAETDGGRGVTGGTGGGKEELPAVAPCFCCCWSMSGISTSIICTGVPHCINETPQFGNSV